jgi:hypothetical protein
MNVIFNGRWQRHDAFGLIVVAAAIAAAIAVGLLSASG